MSPALTPVSASSTRIERLGYACMIGSSLFFAAMGVFVKLASETLPFYEVAFFRVFGGALIAAVVMLAWRMPFEFSEKRLLVVRGVMGWAALMTYFLAIAGLNLADAVFLNHTSPLFTALVAAAFLKERLTVRTLVALALAVLGVALVVGPSGGFLNLSALAALGSAFFAAVAYVAVKRANASNSPLPIVLTFSLVASVLTLPFLVWRYEAPEPIVWGYLAAAAALGTIAQILMTYGYRLARASTASILSLFTPLFAAGLSIAVLAAAPEWGTWVGGALIIGAGATLFLAR